MTKLGTAEFWTARRFIAGWLVLVIGGFALYGAVKPSGPDPVYDALAADRMATYRPAGLSVVRKSDTRSGSSLGKPVLPGIQRVYDAPENVTTAAYEDMRRAATDAGWVFPDPPDRSPGYDGERKVFVYGHRSIAPEIDGHLSLVLTADSDRVDGPPGGTLSIVVVLKGRTTDDWGASR